MPISPLLQSLHVQWPSPRHQQTTAQGSYRLIAWKHYLWEVHICHRNKLPTPTYYLIGIIFPMVSLLLITKCVSQIGLHF